RRAWSLDAPAGNRTRTAALGELHPTLGPQAHTLWPYFSCISARITVRVGVAWVRRFPVRGGFEPLNLRLADTRSADCATESNFEPPAGLEPATFYRLS